MQSKASLNQEANESNSQLQNSMAGASTDIAKWCCVLGDKEFLRRHSRERVPSSSKDAGQYRDWRHRDHLGGRHNGHDRYRDRSYIAAYPTNHSSR